jgi:dTDP-glucose 4,6-dehydratase
LGGETQYEIKYVSDLILRYLVKDDSKVEYKKEEAFTTRIKTPDSAKARRDLDLRLTVPPEEGIPRTIEWFKKSYGLG